MFVVVKSFNWNRKNFVITNACMKNIDAKTTAAL